jgi:putative inorganic carbon (hco3(-)) transporter
VVTAAGVPAESRYLPDGARPARTFGTRQLARVATLGPVAVLALVVPVMWFPWHLPLLTLLALPLIALSLPLSWSLHKHLSARSGLEAPLVYVLLATCLSTVPVTDGQLGLPKLLGMALGAATVVALGNTVASVVALDWAVLALAGTTIALSGVGLVGTEWIVGKFPLLDPVYLHLPALIRGVVPNTSMGGIQPNELAGTLIMLIPILLAQGLRVGSTRRGDRWPLALAGAAGLIALGVLVVTQSRGALVGVSVALALLGGWAALLSARARLGGRLTRTGAPLVWLGAVSVGCLVGWQLVVRWQSSLAEAAVLDALGYRLELWDRAGYMLRDFPFTGIGLGQFNPVLHAVYTPFLVGPDTFVPHAHNMYIEYALELGIPGAVAFGLLVLASVRGCCRAMRSANARLHWTGLGIALGLLAFLIYGLTDAIAPGARAGIVLWTLLGLGGAIGTLARGPARPQRLETSLMNVESLC